MAKHTPARRRTKETQPPAQRTVLIIEPSGVRTLAPDEITREMLGEKGVGLSAIPDRWTLPFMVISSASAARAADIEQEVLQKCLQTSQIDTSNGLLLRSSGANETLRERGHLESSKVSLTEIPDRLASLVSALPKDVSGDVHWLLQAFQSAKRQGHLSNERRLSREPRDWVLEMEAASGSKTVRMPIAIRKWRDGLFTEIQELRCESEMQLQRCLKQVAMWAFQYQGRYHFEWLWDGTKVFLVQMDRESNTRGTDPKQILKRKILEVPVDGLRVFRSASDIDSLDIRKLKNAALYRQLGYEMPSFFVLDDEVALNSLLQGTISDDLKYDLDILARRPLIIRTDGLDIPADKREMLPRSDELRSGDDAATWILGMFRQKIRLGGLSLCSLRLIAHHFIPSVSSAWARADLASPIVRVEALWGIPESLYWHSHDVYEVDTSALRIPGTTMYDGRIFSFNQKLRFKSMFVASNEEGRWEFRRTDETHDWSPTITNDKWLAEIAWVTKQIATEEGKTVAVMWFVDNHPSATGHRILPWYHEQCKSGGTPKAAPRTKFRGSSDLTVATIADWENLKQQCEAGTRIERVLVQPTDPQLIRDLEFAKELGRLSKEKGFVVELLGGILSHVFYALIRAGARVECVDLFGESEEISEFYKLVRDRIPEIIASKGEGATTIRLTGDALVLELRRKLVEEALEALDALNSDELVGELADSLEVIHGLARALSIKYADIESKRKSKAKNRGGFTKGFMLVTTESVRSVPTKGLVEAEEVLLVSEPYQIPLRSHYRRPDLRQLPEGSMEKMLVADSEISRLVGESTERLEFSLENQGGDSDSFELKASLRRQKDQLRVTISVKRGAKQLSLPFD